MKKKFLNAFVLVCCVATGAYAQSKVNGIWIKSDGYLNFGNTRGSVGYGIRDNSGAMEFKDSNGNWLTFPTTGVGSPGGMNKQIQYNNSGSFGGAPLEYDGSSFIMTIPSMGVFEIDMDGIGSSLLSVYNFGTDEFSNRVDFGFGQVVGQTDTYPHDYIVTNSVVVVGQDSDSQNTTEYGRNAISVRLGGTVSDNASIRALGSPGQLSLESKVLSIENETNDGTRDGVSINGTTCTITRVTKGIITAGSCT